MSDYSIIHDLNFDFEDAEDLKERYNLIKYEILEDSIENSRVKFYFNNREDLFNFQCDYNINLEEENNNYLILDNFDEHYLDIPEEYGIVGYSIIGQFHKIYFKNKNKMIKFLNEDYHLPQ